LEGCGVALNRSRPFEFSMQKENTPPLVEGGRAEVVQQINQQNDICTHSQPSSTTKITSSRRSTKRRSRSKVVARKSPSRQRREAAIYDGLVLLGIVKIADDGESIAYDARGKRLGLFPTLQAASAAFDKPPAHGAGG
jgi:hypothetical protein